VRGSLQVQPAPLKRRFRRLISEGNFVTYVNGIKNHENIENSKKCQLSLNKKHRSPYDIQFEILNLSKDGLNQTNIQYKVYLSYLIVTNYLDGLISLGLIQYNEENKIYKTTDLGYFFIDAFQELKKTLTDEEIEPIILDEKSRNIAIEALKKNKNRKTIYDKIGLILYETSEKPKNKFSLMTISSTHSEGINSYIEFLTKLRFLEYHKNTNLYKTTQIGSKYLEAYLYFILFNYLQ